MRSALSFEINLAGNFATALEKANTGLKGTAEGSKHAKHELELFEGEKMGFKDGWVLVGVPKTANAPYSKVMSVCSGSTRM